jgi:hypothetical protein
MSEEQARNSERLLQTFYMQIHLTVLYEQDFIERLGGYTSLLDYRDQILDNINFERRKLKYI